MKKIGLLVSILFVSILFTACGVKNVDGTLEELMAKVYEGVPEDERPMMLSNIEVTSENVEGFLGTNDIEFEEALASESMVGSIAHSVVLVRTKKNADIESIKDKIEASVNPRKWICVEAENVVVKSKGNLIILIMVNDHVEEIENSFDNL